MLLTKPNGRERTRRGHESAGAGKMGCSHRVGEMVGRGAVGVAA